MRTLLRLSLFLSCLALSFSMLRAGEDESDSSDLLTQLKKVKSLPLPAEKLIELSNSVDYKRKTYTLKSDISVNLPKDKNKREKTIAKLNKKKKIPIRIISTVKWVPTGSSGKKPKYNFKGSAELYLIDANNKIALKKKVKLNKLCPT